MCACGGLNATRLEQNIVYHEIARAHAKQPLLVAAAGNASATDFCASYQNTCSAFLNAIACPASQQANVGCETPGDYSSFVNECNCAGAVDGSLEARNAIIEYLAKPAVKALTVYEAGEGGYVKLCPTFENVCGRFLDQIQCPAAERVNKGCAAGNDYETYQGRCMCGGIDAGDRVRRLVIDTYIGPKVEMISDSFTTTGGIDFCNAFTCACALIESSFFVSVECMAGKRGRRSGNNQRSRQLTAHYVSISSPPINQPPTGSCNQWLENTIKCPKRMISNQNNCGSASGMEIQGFRGQCTCGALD
jgi:hypothetical protein